MSSQAKPYVELPARSKHPSLVAAAGGAVTVTNMVRHETKLHTVMRGVTHTQIQMRVHTHTHTCTHIYTRTHTLCPPPRPPSHRFPEYIILRVVHNNVLIITVLVQFRWKSPWSDYPQRRRSPRSATATAIGGNNSKQK